MKNTPLRRRTRIRQVSDRKKLAREEAAAIWAACYERDGGRCFRCGTPRGKLECHHRLGGGLGPDTLENLIMLEGLGNNPYDADGNPLCHGQAHTDPAEAQENGWVISRHDRRPPQRVPVRHYAYGMVYLTADGRVLPVDSVVAWSVDGLVPFTEGDLARLGGGHD